MPENSGEVFDNSKSYSQNPKEIRKFFNHYFSDKEIKGKKILDAGCRVGDYSVILAEKGAKGVVGVDLSEECIKVANDRYKTNKKLRFFQGDISNLKKLKDSEFDVVVCVGTIFYLSPENMEKALNEFVRVTKPNGTILVLFQKDKDLGVRTFRNLVNVLPLNLYLFLINNFSFLLKPAVESMVGRKISDEYLKYDVLLSLRGIVFGVPVDLPKKFITPTVTCEQCSEKTTTTYKIRVPKNKKILSG